MLEPTLSLRFFPLNLLYANFNGPKTNRTVLKVDLGPKSFGTESYVFLSEYRLSSHFVYKIIAKLYQNIAKILRSFVFPYYILSSTPPPPPLKSSQLTFIALIAV